GFVEGNGNSNSPKYYNFTDNNIVKTGAYNYRLKQIDNDGTYKYSNIAYVNVSSPDNYYLSQNYPNPFNPNTTISWQSPESDIQSLKVFDLLGNEVSTLIDEYKPAGDYEIKFNANGLPSGMYFYRLTSGKHIETKMMLLLK
ncbi:T9SS type A sorting domain-containing protein, partial [bacterium BMS3Abin03]|nr:T9SS type A sorting domain-containing protein [bacterium BMS3Abin03]